MVAGEVYAALLEQPHDGRAPVVCFRDADGGFVRRPWAAEYPSERVTDTAEPCPACGHADWDEYTPFEEWRGGSGSKVDGTHVANPIVSCRVCGHEEPEPSFMTMPSEPIAAADDATRAARIARFRAEFRQRRWHAIAEVLRTLEFPIYVADPWPARITGHGSQDGETTNVTVHHYDTTDCDPWSGARPRLAVTTKRVAYRLEPIAEARRALEHWISNASAPSGERWPDASRAAITLWQRARERERRAMVLDAVRAEQLIEIDGAPTSMLTLGLPAGLWTGAVRLGELIIVVAVRDLKPTDLRLIALDDPATALLGVDPDS